VHQLQGGLWVFFGQILFFWREARIFFFLHQNQNIFQQQWESDYLKKKNIPHPLEVNWSVPKDKKS
jgi:hypothetical protein